MAKLIKRMVESWTYVPIADRALEAGEQTAFRLSPLSQAELFAVTDDLQRTIIEPDGTQVITSRERQTALRLCLSHIASVENFPVGAPQPWPEEREKRRVFLEQFDHELVRELGDEIYGKSRIGVAEKN